MTATAKLPPNAAVDIVARIRAGEKSSVIARDYGVSRQRISQIWYRRGGGNPVKTFQLVPPYHRVCRCGAFVPRGAEDHVSSQVHSEYRRARFERAFWALVDVQPSGHWMWTGTKNPVSGYGVVGRILGSPFGDKRRTLYAHRVAYALAVGPIQEGLTIDHLCRIVACVNPAHLEAVTQRENTLRSPNALAAINARKTHCKHGHPFDSANTLYQENGRHRSCRACHRIQAHDRYLRKKAVA